MDKVVCPACGLVNLEKFVTYPHCAACGELLTHAPPPRVALWRRPISALLWATALGLCCAALGVAGILTARETRHSEARRLVVYLQVPRRLNAGQVGKIQIGLDDLEMGAGVGAAFEEVQLRLPRALLENFVLIGVSPTPRNRKQRHNGIYFDFGSLSRDQNLFVSLRPRRAGLRAVELSLYARDFLPYRWNGNLRIGPGPSFPRPTSLRPSVSPAAVSPAAVSPAAVSPAAVSPAAVSPPVLSPARANSVTTRQTGRYPVSRSETKMSQKDDDRALAKAARGAMARSALDISELNIVCVGGFIDLQGKVRAPRGGAGTVSVKREFEQIKVLVRSVRGVKDVRGDRVQLIEAS